MTVKTEHPSPSDSFGNNGSTSSNGPNWVDYLTYHYNSSLILTYDLAMSGATVNSSIVLGSEGADLVRQYDEVFTDNYNSSSFDPASTLFAFWFGVNDVFNSIGGDNATYDLVGKSYRHYVDALYSEQGARKMLYQKIVNSFPEGWMNSGQISREGKFLSTLKLLYLHVC